MDKEFKAKNWRMTCPEIQYIVLIHKLQDCKKNKASDKTCVLIAAVWLNLGRKKYVWEFQIFIRLGDKQATEQ